MAQNVPGGLVSPRGSRAFWEGLVGCLAEHLQGARRRGRQVAPGEAWAPRQGVTLGAELPRHTQPSISQVAWGR